jgi:aspartate-semialdehyde dehydrogenase
LPFSPAGGQLEWAPKFAEVGTLVIDNLQFENVTSKKLIVPEINAKEIKKIKS